MDLQNSINVRKREKLQSYILTINLDDTIKEIKFKIGQALKFDLRNSSFYIVGYKFQRKLENINSLQELCGSYFGTAQLQFFLNYSEVNFQSRIYILKIFRINDNNDLCVHANYLWNCLSKQKKYRQHIISNSDHEDREELLSNFGELNKKICTTKWVISPDFKELRAKLAMPKDPMDWTSGDVEIWLQWCKHEFNLPYLKTKNNVLDGHTLFNFSVSQFKHLVPYDPDNFFHMHFELLRKTHIVASPIRVDDSIAPVISCTPNILSKADKNELNCSTKSSTIMKVSPVKESSKNKTSTLSSYIQLWQFLLELLTDPEFTDIINWCGANGEFQFKQPEEVAKLWGAQKGKSNMTYVKLARSLRYYYCSEYAMFTKKVGQKFVYKFELDLHEVLGYSPVELMEQMNYNNHRTCV